LGFPDVEHFPKSFWKQVTHGFGLTKTMGKDTLPAGRQESQIPNDKSQLNSKPSNSKSQLNSRYK
jgi:hypothetical protein